MADPIDKGPAPASPLPWVAGPFPLGTSGMALVETRDAEGGHVLVACRARAATDAADRANEAAICHRVNHWDALVARCERYEQALRRIAIQDHVDEEPPDDPHQLVEEYDDVTLAQVIRHCAEVAREALK